MIAEPRDRLLVTPAVDEAAVGAASLLRSAANSDWRGSDPYDGLWWRWPRVLTGGPKRRQAIAQLHARSPIDIRRLRRGERPPIPKALGVWGSVGTRLARLTGDARFERLALGALELLDADCRAGSSAWGYHWDVQTRWSFYPAGTPNVVVTAFAAGGLDDGAERLGITRFRDRARDAARWVLEELFLEEEGIFAYHPGSRVLIHNASMLGARLVHDHLDGDGGARERVARAVERTLAGQRADGSWPYGEGRRLGFVDSFHTGYVLDCLSSLRSLDPRVEEAVRLGASYYVERFFDPDGSARLWADREFPIDAHSAGTGLTAVAELVRHGDADRDFLATVVRRAAATMLRDGHAIFRRYRLGRTTVRYIRWCDAHLALGLANAALVLAGDPVEAVACG